MAEDCGEAGRDAEGVWFGGVGWKPICDKGRDPGASDVAFEAVNDQDNDAGGFTEHAKDIGRADVAAAALANVDAAETAGEVTGGQRAQQVPDQRHHSVGDEVHERNLGLWAGKFKGENMDQMGGTTLMPNAFCALRHALTLRLKAVSSHRTPKYREKRRGLRPSRRCVTNRPPSRR